MSRLHRSLFFSHDTPPTEIYTLSLHDALPILLLDERRRVERCHRWLGALRVKAGVFEQLGARVLPRVRRRHVFVGLPRDFVRSEEHTSELHSLAYLVCRLLLEKKKKQQIYTDK